MKERNIFSSKANVLDFFQRKIRNSKIEKMYGMGIYPPWEFVDVTEIVLKRT